MSGTASVGTASVGTVSYGSTGSDLYSEIFLWIIFLGMIFMIGFFVRHMTYRCECNCKDFWYYKKCVKDLEICNKKLLPQIIAGEEEEEDQIMYS